MTGPFGAYDKASWNGVRHSILAVARMIEAEASDAPGFCIADAPEAHLHASVVSTLSVTPRGTG